MKRFLSYLDPSRHLIIRVWLQTTAIVVASTIGLVLLLSIVLDNLFIDRSLQEAQFSTSVAATALTESYQVAVLGIQSTYDTQDFRKLLANINTDDEEISTQLNLFLQSYLSTTISRHNMVSSALIINKNGTCFSPISLPQHESQHDMSFYYSPDAIHGITLLPAIPNPQKPDKNVIVLAFPLSNTQDPSQSIFTDDFASADAVLYLMGDETRFINYLRSYASEGICGNLYLINPAGQILNPDKLGNDASSDSLPAITSLIQDMDPAVATSGAVKLNNDLYACWQYVPECNVFMVNQVEREQLLLPLQRVLHMLPLFGITCILMATLLMMILSRLVTSPVRKLQKMVLSIQNGTYDGLEAVHLKDELGQLNDAIMSMYATINRQITELQQEQEARSHAELRAISQQINPHFLYNTLEAINMEVYAQHTENASDMIQSLGEFLRIGLSFNSNVITLNKELEHVHAYISIMNHRFGNRLVYTPRVDDAYRNLPVLKIILQPLVENSIRHGFHMDSDTAMLSDLFIDIEVHQENGELLLSVIDNGVGIDIEKAQKCLNCPPCDQKHVGLSNVYQRLRMHYGDRASITFETIPYYRNTVCIHIPLDQPSGSPTSD